MITSSYKNHKFNDSDIINPEDIEYGGKPFLIYSEYETIGVIFAANEQEALDEAADKGILKSCKLSNEEVAELHEEQEDYTCLGDDSAYYDLQNIGLVNLPTPTYSFCAMFNASFPSKD